MKNRRWRGRDISIRYIYFIYVKRLDGEDNESTSSTMLFTRNVIFVVVYIRTFVIFRTSGKSLEHQ